MHDVSRRMTFDAAAELVIGDVRSQFPEMTREEAFCHAVQTTELEELRKLPMPHATAEGTAEFQLADAHNELVDAYRLVLQRDHRPDHDELLDCLQKLRVYDADAELAVGCGSGTGELSLLQRVWILRARRGDLPERTPTRAQLIHTLRCVVRRQPLSPHQERWLTEAALGQLT